MAAQELEVDISRAMCLSLRCTVDTRSWPCFQLMSSSEFRFQGGVWKVRYMKYWTQHILYLSNCSRVAPRPLRATAHLVSHQEGRIVNVLPEVRCFAGEFQRKFCYEKIWKREEEEILKSAPEFRLHGILKLVAVLKAGGEECPCATCQFTAADDSVPSLESFSKDLGDLLDQDASTDVEFRCADADDNILTTVKAHKLVVCARSPVLAAMLHSDMVEGRTGVATVRDIDADVFKQFLKYLYSGKLDETTVDAAMSLYEAGDRFQVKSLTEHCAKWMARNLTVEKSCEVLLLADAHADEELAEATLAFMANQKVPRVFHGWEDFCSKHLELSNRVLRFCELINDMSPESKYSCSKTRIV